MRAALEQVEHDGELSWMRVSLRGVTVGATGSRAYLARTVG